MSDQSEMPRYKCHKEVHALKIIGIRKTGEDTELTCPVTEISVEPPFLPIRVDYEWIEKHTPVVGGYYVVYEDGYTSFSPAEAFETGYTLLEGAYS